ncbi:hypothetical protein C0993_011338, partial [Termitomyces sp. T159_Od127]
CVWVSRSVKVIREIDGEEGIYDRHDCWKIVPFAVSHTDADVITTLLRTSTRHRHRQTAEELEEEDRAAHSAKLQELIRRGTPRDLAAAQELMKALAGANPDAKPDHRTQALTELNKLEQKVILLNEMLDNFDTQRSEQFAKGEVYDVRDFSQQRLCLIIQQQVSSILASAGPRLSNCRNGSWTRRQTTPNPLVSRQHASDTSRSYTSQTPFFR